LLHENLITIIVMRAIFLPDYGSKRPGLFEALEESY